MLRNLKNFTYQSHTFTCTHFLLDFHLAVIIVLSSSLPCDLQDLFLSSTCCNDVWLGINVNFYTRLDQLMDRINKHGMTNDNPNILLSKYTFIRNPITHDKPSI